MWQNLEAINCHSVLKGNVGNLKLLIGAYKTFIKAIWRVVKLSSSGNAEYRIQLLVVNAEKLKGSFIC